MPITRIEIEKGLMQLGVTAGMMLEVHSSLRNLGYVDGGALMVIEALKHIVGRDGAIVMPSFKLSPDLPLTETDKKLGLTQKIKVLHTDNEKSRMGIVPETFRKMPGIVTGEGIFRVSAWGKDAERHAESFQHLIDSGGYALLMGVDIYKMSAMHYVEDALPDEIKNRFAPSQEAREVYPESDWFLEAWNPPVKPWYTIQDRAYEAGYIADGMIGNAKCMLVQVKNTIELYRQALQNEPFELYGLV
ncbi:MAG: AAC(3) family N-acetyltransferase [Oscillospiraceae bacterium]|nr:AAC(3) family N-acetyltransferase [Oscillospiraceae bacterium]